MTNSLFRQEVVSRKVWLRLGNCYMVLSQHGCCWVFLHWWEVILRKNEKLFNRVNQNCHITTGSIHSRPFYYLPSNKQKESFFSSFFIFSANAICYNHTTMLWACIFYHKKYLRINKGPSSLTSIIHIIQKWVFYWHSLLILQKYCHAILLAKRWQYER